MWLKPFVKMCIFVVIQIFWSLRKYREQMMMMVMVMVMVMVMMIPVKMP